LPETHVPASTSPPSTNCSGHIATKLEFGGNITFLSLANAPNVANPTLINITVTTVVANNISKLRFILTDLIS
jgi:hypothetical protein